MKRPVLLPLLVASALAFSLPIEADTNQRASAVEKQTQSVDYTISARLDDAAGVIRGAETIRYRNLSRDTLSDLCLHLYPNAFRDRGTAYARELEAMGRYDFSLTRERSRGSIRLDWTESGGRVGLMYDAGTELALILNPPLAPGETVSISIGFHTKVPATGAELARKGRGFVLAHWFPEVAARQGLSPSSNWLLGGYHVFGHSPAAFADYHVVLDLAPDLDIAATGAASDSQAYPAGPGRKAVHIEATNVAGFAVAALPGLKKMARTIEGVDVTILARSFSNPDWYYALMSVADMLHDMQQWNGPFPFAGLTIVDGSGVVAQDASHPGLIVMATGPIPYTRIFEQELARQVALQWSRCATGADELTDPAIVQGPAAYSAMRYMDDKYGRTSLVSNPVFGWLLRGLNSEYYNRLYYYLGASNNVLCPDPTRCRDQVGYQAAEQSGPALLLLAEERRQGRTTFDPLLRTWTQGLPGKDPTVFDPVSILHARGTDASRAPDTVLPSRLGNRRVTIQPVFELPSFSDYQIFYGPYFWADAYSGAQCCVWAQGRQFFDVGPLRGRHQWMVSEIYSTHIHDLHSSVNYQTPLTFIDDRLRLYAALDYSTVDAGAKLYFSQELGPVYRQPKTTIDFGYRVLDVKRVDFRDTNAWELGRTADLRLHIAQSYETRLLLGSAQLLARKGMTALGSDSNYLRLGIEQSHTWRGLRPVELTLRAFAGCVWGNVPKQDQFYLSGGLISNGAEPVTWGYKGISSGQENWHYDADVNCRGYAGLYLHGRAAYGLNFQVTTPKLGLISASPFFDLGNVGDSLNQAGFWNPRMDAGLKLTLGPLYADFPVWRFQSGVSDQRFAFRWMLGLKVSGTLGSS
ncbi:MAG TPA: hypothetical protein VMH22_15635 [bacterium]|nr:hypothetical protein [bacterium]